MEGNDNFFVTIQPIVQRSATLGLIYVHKILVLTLKQKHQCLRG